MEYYVFTGNPESLETLGYAKEALYSRNYTAYKKNEIIMFENQNMAIESNGLDPKSQREVIKFILLNKHQDRSFWVEDLMLSKVPIKLSDMAIFQVTRFGKLITRQEHSIGRVEYMKKFSEIIRKRDSWFFGKISEDEAEKQLQELDKTEFARDTFKIGIEFVEQIIELDNLHRLEVLEFDEETGDTKKVENTIYY